MPLKATARRSIRRERRASVRGGWLAAREARTAQKPGRTSSLLEESPAMRGAGDLSPRTVRLRVQVPVCEEEARASR
jgi:hypothetical protein